jgi:hypothetical protein
MKAISNVRALSKAGVVAAGLLAFAAQNALGAAPAGPNPPRVQKIRQPAGTPHPASSFAPHPTNRRVFGDPIQPPILGQVAPKNPPPK